MFLRVLGFSLRRRFLEGCGREGHREKQIKGCMVLLSCRRRLLQGFGCEDQPTKRIKTPHAFLALLLCRVFGRFWLWRSTHKKIKTPHRFPGFFRSHGDIGFWKVSTLFLFWSLIQLARAGCGDEPQKNLKRHMVFLCFSVSLRCRVLEGSCCESQFTEKS